MRPFPLAAFAIINLLPSANAIWPFRQKRFVAEALIDAGPLGLEAMTGRVVAVGDWNGDQKLDLFTLSEDSKTLQIHLWDRDSFRYQPSHNITFSSEIGNVIPGDLNHDGRLDLLVMLDNDKGGWWGSKSESLGMEVFLGGGVDGGFRQSLVIAPDEAEMKPEEEHWTLPASAKAQPMVFDADSSLRPSLLGYQAASPSMDAILMAWANNGTGLTMQTPPLQSPGQACQLADPHSSAYVDIDGDCLPGEPYNRKRQKEPERLEDLVLHCERPNSQSRFIQIWLNRGTGGYVLAREYDLPDGSGPLSFADMDRDGTIDMVFSACPRHSTSGSIGFECSINIAYNKQVPVCRGEGPTYRVDETMQGDLTCRGWGGLCLADEGFEFSFDPSDEYFSSIPMSSIFTMSPDDGLLLHPPSKPFIPLPLRPGDFKVDGFPDLLITFSNSTAASGGGIFGGSPRSGNQVRVVENVPCGKGIAGCDARGHGRRGLRLAGGKGWEVLNEIWDVSGASWIDIDDDGSLDILVQRTGAQSGQKVTFIQNNFYHDAFFLKAQGIISSYALLVLNGACDGECQPADGGKKYSALGASYSGATYKFIVLDTLGRRVAQQVAQLPQTSYHALHTPYAVIGLGRTNNYVERLFVGASLRPPGHTSTIESLIPNSQVIINPPSLHHPDQIEQSPPVKARSQEWRSELFLHPGDWIPSVAAAVIGTVLLLGMVVFGLNEREKKEDEKERRRALHAINFQAL